MALDEVFKVKCCVLDREQFEEKFNGFKIFEFFSILDGDYIFIYLFIFY